MLGAYSIGAYSIGACSIGAYSIGAYSIGAYSIGAIGTQISIVGYQACSAKLKKEALHFYCYFVKKL